MNWEKFCSPVIVLGFLLFLPGCVTLEKNTVFLTDKDKVYLVPANKNVTVLWAKKEINILTDEDMVLLYKGTYLRLEKEANQNLLK